MPEGDVKVIELKNVRSDFSGFQTLAEAFHKVSTANERTFIFKMPSWFDANMMAILGGLLQTITHQKKQYVFRWKNEKEKDKVRKIALKNTFLQKMGFGQDKISPDTHSTTITYDIYNVQEPERFNGYVRDHFIPKKKGVINMSEKVAKEFRRNILELYSNAADHSETKLGIFVCGQFYPRRKDLEFTVFDLGIGVQNRIQESLGLSLTQEEALRWVFAEGNTTRKALGGHGLKILRETVKLNGGCIHFVSHKGYLAIDKEGEHFSPLAYPIPGTAVCIKFITADKGKYIFQGEQP